MGCGAAVENISYDPLEPRSDFLVEVKTEAPQRSVQTVSQSIALADPSGSMPQMPSADTVTAMRKAAAARGANYLLIERLDTRWRRAYFGTGLKLSATSAGEAPACSHGGAIEAKADVVKATGRCLQALKTSRTSLRAKVLAKLNIDASGGLKSIDHEDNSSKDALVRQCLMKAGAKQSYGVSGAYVCSITIDMELQ